jgi:DMSO/TMAO reductase YedYZ molybdopterin-dependent catalytic subunit
MMNRPAQGTQWKLGGIGFATWTGVPLSALLDRAGIKGTAREVMAIGLDQPRVRRPIPVAKAVEQDCILAYMMNGDILPIDHGFPARTVVPAWGGVNSVKWVGTIMVTEEHNEVDWNTTSYVLVGPDFPDPAGAARGPTFDEQVMKSAVALPWPATLSAGQQTVRGYAWTPNGTITRVEVSIDGGSSWAPARLIEPNVERGGVRWEFTFQARPGDMTITPRAVDVNGPQPNLAQVRWNELGYGFSAPVPHPVRVT